MLNDILQEYVRNWLKMLIGEFTDPLENKVSQAEAKAFEQEFATDPLKRPCTIDDFRYFLDGGPRSAWNIGASYVLLDFIEQKRLIDVSTSIARGAVREAFLARIKTLRGEYLKLAKSAETQALKNQYNRKYQRKYSVTLFSTLSSLEIDDFLEAFPSAKGYFGKPDWPPALSGLL